MRELFVWYRVDAHNADAARVQVDAMLRALERDVPGLQARLLIRREADRQTWMETFTRPRRSPGEPGGIDAAVEATIAAAAAALLPLLASDRHVEAFDVAGRAS